LTSLRVITLGLALVSLKETCFIVLLPPYFYSVETKGAFFLAKTLLSWCFYVTVRVKSSSSRDS